MWYSFNDVLKSEAEMENSFMTHQDDKEWIREPSTLMKLSVPPTHTIQTTERQFRCNVKAVWLVFSLVMISRHAANWRQYKAGNELSHPTFLYCKVGK